MERVPELILPYIQINYYFKCHHRTYIQLLIEADAENYSGVLVYASKIELKSGKSENMSNEVKTMMGTQKCYFFLRYYLLNINETSLYSRHSKTCP